MEPNKYNPYLSLSVADCLQVDVMEGEHYAIKEIPFGAQGKVPIVLQNANGPCPLLAIVNTLLLRDSVSLPPSALAHKMISFEDLVSLVGARVLSVSSFSRSPGAEEGGEREGEQDGEGVSHLITEAMDTLPSLAVGLDFNPRFNSVSGHEYTSNIVLFDLLDIPLLHGWVIDPQDPRAPAVGELTYNQAVDVAISGDESNGGGGTDSVVVRSWLEDSAGQLTHHGLAELHAHMPHLSFAVLYRNHHYSTLFKSDNGQLFALVTDIGYAEYAAVWEVLASIDGDVDLLCGDFSPFVGQPLRPPPKHRSKHKPKPRSSHPPSRSQQQQPSRSQQHPPPRSQQSAETEGEAEARRRHNASLRRQKESNSKCLIM